MNVGISPSEALEVLASYDLALVVLGVGLLAVALLPRLLHDKPFSVPIAMVALGMAAFALPLGLPAPDPVQERELVERIAELGVILSLMVAGLTIDRAPGLREWSATWRLLAITMPLTVGAVALLGWWAGLAPAAAVLLGAVISPTDPVLGKDVETGAPLEGADERETEEHDLTSAGEEDEVRFGLSSEAGLNDGLAFPYTNMAIAMALVGAAPGNWFASWLAVDVALKIAIALLLGWAVGRSLGRLLLRAPAQSDLSRTVTGIGAVAATFIVYGLTEAAGGYGFIATFVCAASIRGLDRCSDRHRDLQGVAEVVERMLLATIMILFGGAIAAGGLFDALEWQFALVAIAVLLVVRPLAGAIGLLGFSRAPWRDRAALGFYGIRGIATFYYLAYALGKAQFDQAQALWATAGLVVLLSVVVHGLTAAEVMQRLDRRREAERAG